MLLPLVFCILILYCPFPDAPADWSVRGIVAAVAVTVLANAVLGWGGTRFALRLRARRGDLAATKVFAVLRAAVVAFVLVDAFLLHWQAVPAVMRKRWPDLILLDDVVLLLPVFAMALTLMSWRHRYEVGRGGPSLSLWRYLVLRSQTELALILAPWLALMLVSDASVVALARLGWPPWLADVAFAAGIAAILVLSPWLIRAVWRISPLGAGALGERLEDACRRWRFRCNGIFVWHTYRHMANAAVVGPTRLLRYVVLSDALIERCTPEEVEAVFAHEVGHVKRRHMPFYVFFAAAFFCFYLNLADIAGRAGWMRPLVNLLESDLRLDQAGLQLLCAAVYWGLGFGLLSRYMEQEADLFSISSVGDPEAFVSVLERLAVIDRVPRQARFWRHFSIARRVAFLQRAIADPSVGVRFRRRLFAAKVAILVLFAAGMGRLLIVRPELFGAA